MTINNVRVLNEDKTINIVAGEGKIVSISASGTLAATGDLQIFFTDAIAFPGLINSHDHLDFNCFSPLGKRKYTNYTEWGNDIHTNHKKDIDAVLKIPQNLRTSWGMYKNLLSGVTTVVNHGELLTIEKPLIAIYQEVQNLHSVQFQKKWKLKLNNPVFKNKPCVIHTGEGVDKQSADEIDELLKWNLWNRALIGVHGVSMNEKQSKKFKGLVWCPESNKILLNKHAGIDSLKSTTKIVFGTDSTLTGNWNIWHHLRLARSLKLVSDSELFSMVTSAAAELWGLNTGEIQTGKDADLVVAKTRKDNPGQDDFFSVNPADILLVMSKGKIRLFDSELLPQLKSLHFDTKAFSCIDLNGCIKFAEGDLPALADSIKSYYPGALFPFKIAACKKSGHD